MPRNPQIAHRWTNAEKLSLLELVAGYTSEDREVDWCKISNLISGVSPMECFMQFNNVDNPDINTSPWTAAEETKLLVIVNKYKSSEWDNICDDLNTGRTPWQCFEHYQQSLNPHLVKSTEWTLEEDLQLKRAVEMYGEKQWMLVAQEVPGRSAYQCNLRWRRSIVCHEGRTEGRWSDEDQVRLLLAAVAYDAPLVVATCHSDEKIDEKKRSLGIINEDEYTERQRERFESAIIRSAGHSDENLQCCTSSGKDFQQQATSSSAASNTFNWKAVAELVPGKDENKCREKWVNCLDPSLRLGPLTDDEDRFLLALVTSSGGPGDWATHAKYFPGRSDNQLYLRWKTLVGRNQAKAYSKDKSLKRKISGSKLARQIFRKQTRNALDVTDFEAVIDFNVSPRTTCSEAYTDGPSEVSRPIMQLLDDTTLLGNNF